MADNALVVGITYIQKKRTQRIDMLNTDFILYHINPVGLIEPKRKHCMIS